MENSHNKTLKLRAAPVGSASPPPTSGEVDITLPRRLRPTLARDALPGSAAVEVAPDEIARVELENGFVFWSRADDLLRDRGRQAVSRGDGSEAWEIDTAARTDGGPIDGSELGLGGDASGARGALERGALGLGIKLLDVFGVDLKQKSAALFGKAFEEKRLRGATPGLLHRCTYAPGQAEPLVVTPLDAATIAALAGDRPLLVFLHGTMSSVAGSFGDLWAAGPGAAGSAPAARSVLLPDPLADGRNEGRAASGGASTGLSPLPSHQRGEGVLPGGMATFAGSSAREAMARRYGEHIYAFEHRTLTESPIRNALDLVGQLPAGAQLHLVSHSRGGLVGELLCLAERDRRDDPLRADLLDALFAADRTMAEQLGLGALDGDAARARDAGYDTDRKALAELVAALDAKQIKVRRFVRVACPARGTTLASGRMDRWLSVVNLLTGNGLAGGVIGGVTGGVIADVADFLLAVVKERTDPRALPGIEAMMPGSALTRLLAHPELVTGADLSVISGDLEPSGRWGQLKLLAVDWFYGSDHDLVVNTGSMLGGIRRGAGGARFQRDQGDGVTHFNYFANSKSVRWLIGGLTRADGEDGGFLPIAEAKQEEPRWRAAVRASRDAATPQPLAILIPGTMGSALTVRGKPVWLDYWALARGGLSELGWPADGTHADVEPTALLDQFYAPLIEHLARSHRVEILAYDWRASVREAAKALARKLQTLLPEAERTQQPVHIVAHSMGGLVARAMIADNGNSNSISAGSNAADGAQTWRRICALPGSRLLMLGTPNLGSYEAVRWLTGFNPTEAKLTLLDLHHRVDDIIDIVRRFPGLVELLPFADPQEPFANAATWAALKRELGAGWNPVDAATLQVALSTWSLLRGALPDASRMVYVAGCQKATVVGHRIVVDDVDSTGRQTAPQRRIEWLASREGDGTVAWASGRLADVPVYYAPDTAHDELCSNTADSRIFRGYVELLRSGKTDQLSTRPPPAARAAVGEPAVFVLPPAPVADAIPDQQQLRSLSFSGARPRRPRDSGRTISSTIEVGIRHGDLAYAKHAVLVGHYAGDTIVSAEAALDRRLHGALSRRRDLGLYPGPLGSHAVFVDPRAADGCLAATSGALVVGLGQVGELTPQRLETAVRDTLLECALRVANAALLPKPLGAAAAAGDTARAGQRRVRASCLLVGTGAGELRIADSIEAILRGALAANRRLEEARLDQQVLVDQIEFLELYEDLAINAARELGRVLRNDELAARVQWPTRCIFEGEGRRQRRSFEAGGDWWQRLEIIDEATAEAGGRAPANSGATRLRFIATTDRARAEQTLAQGQLQLADAFIAQACASAASNDDVARTLFEMLLPVDLKQAAPDQRDVVLLLDETSARYPWELLENRWSHTGRPPAVACGMVRQLKVQPGGYRVDPRHAHDNSVFVVGNPDLDGWALFPDLPGARREATTVQRLFDKAGHPNTACIDQKALAILSGLHSKAWRVLHLAGHGEHEFELPPAVPAAGADALTLATAAAQPGRRVSGMVIGDNTFLTPGDIEQMRFVPELVFINCCHLGQTLGTAGVGNPGRSSPAYNRLAANLGVEFIRMGVKAVVAAGWAVDDGAAETFALTFYECLLAGDSFGRAVQSAREAAWRKHPGANTWGAYQCYGDPGWRFVRHGEVAANGAPQPYVLATEWVADLHNLAEQLRVTSRQPGDDDAQARSRLVERLQAMQARVPESRRDDWLARADVNAAIGFAHSEGGLFAEAIEWLERSMASPHGDAPVRAVEQSANLQVRLATSAWAAAVGGAETPGSGQADGASALAADKLADLRAQTMARIESAIDELAFINRRAPNAERRCLLGAAYKRMAWVAGPGEARRAALIQMTEHYAAALAAPEKPGQIDRYAFCNWAIARLLVARIDAARADDDPVDSPAEAMVDDWRERLADVCAACEQQTLAAFEERPDVWSASGLGDIHLVQLLASTDAGAAAALADGVSERYAAALARGASARERSSLRENLEFLLAIDDVWSDAVREALAGIRQGL